MTYVWITSPKSQYEVQDGSELDEIAFERVAATAYILSKEVNALIDAFTTHMTVFQLPGTLITRRVTTAKCHVTLPVQADAAGDRILQLLKHIGSC